MELFKKHICKVKAMDARGKKQPATAQPPLHLLPTKTPVKLLLPSTMSLHVPATSVLAKGPCSLHTLAKGLCSSHPH